METQIRKSLPDLDDNKIKELLTKLSQMGVKKFEDLEVIGEEDLTSILTVVEARRLLKIVPGRTSASEVQILDDLRCKLESLKLQYIDKEGSRAHELRLQQMKIEEEKAKTANHEKNREKIQGRAKWDTTIEDAQRTAGFGGSSAGIGAAAGLLVGGPPGAAIGAGIGALFGLGAGLTRSSQTREDSIKRKTNEAWKLNDQTTGH